MYVDGKTSEVGVVYKNHSICSMKYLQPRITVCIVHKDVSQ